MIAGQLRHRVDIEQPTAAAANAYGETLDTWSALVTKVPARVEVASGVEGLRAAQVHPDATLQVLTRYRAGMTTAMRLKFGDRYLYPVAIIPDVPTTQLVWHCKEEL